MRSVSSAIVAAALALAAACSQSSATPRDAQPRWSSCHEAFECATVDVPVDYAKPDGAKIGIKLLRIAATSPDERVGSLVINPGGPGGAMVDRLADTYFTLRVAFPDIARRFDLVAFDWRGVGQSAPVDCADDALLDTLRATDLTLRSPGSVAAVDTLAKALAAGCAARANPELLANVHTENAARDLDRIRAGLGEEKLNYIGFSYGTWLGAKYATLFPGRVRSFVLDSAVAPVVDIKHDIERHAQSHDLGLNRFFEFCARTATCPFHGGRDAATIAAAFDALVSKIEALPHGLRAGTRSLSTLDTQFALADGLRAADFARLGADLLSAESGDGSALLKRADIVAGRKADGTYDNTIEGLLAIACIDEPFSAALSLSDYAAFIAGLRRNYPRSTSLAAIPWALCTAWPYHRSADPIPVSASGAPPMLIVSGKYDPITGYDGAQSLARVLGNNSPIVTYEGDGHAASFHSACVRTIVSDFLIDPAAPLKKTTCQPD